MTLKCLKKTFKSILFIINFYKFSLYLALSKFKNMKKLLLLLLLSSSASLFAQVLESENFNTLPIGNIGTDFTGLTPGLSGYLTAASNGTAPTTSTNAGNSNFQVVANGNNSSNGFQIISPNGDKGNRFMWKDGFDLLWNARTTGNNIVELEYDFFTGPITDSRTQIGMRVFGADGANTRSLVGFVYTTNTRVLSGVCYLNNGGTFGTFLVNLATGGLILDANTWYTIGCSYNTVTGQTLWKTSPTSPSTGLANTFWVPNLVPNEVDFVQVVVAANATANPPVPANTATSTIVFDNYLTRASNTDTLLNNVTFAEDSLVTINLYPNPVNDILNINSKYTLNNISISDINGRVVRNTSLNGTEAQINIADLASGIYLLKVVTSDGTVTKKVIKE